MKLVSVQEAKTHLSALLVELESGAGRIVVCRDGKPVADLIPHEQELLSMQPHPELGAFTMNYDPIAPLSDEEWPAR